MARNQCTGFTEALVRHMLRDREETAKTCKEWRELYPDDLTKAALEFANQLHHDMEVDWCCWDNKFINDVFRLALLRTNFRRAADLLLEHFAPPSPDEAFILFTAVRCPSLN